MAESSEPPIWRKRCANNACIEVAPVDDCVLMRDSQDPQGPRLAFEIADWKAFVDELHAGGLADRSV